jgi:hypothetical protein
MTVLTPVKQNKHDFSPPSTAVATVLKSESTVLSSPLPSSNPSSSDLTPPTTAGSEEALPNGVYEEAATLPALERHIDATPHAAVVEGASTTPTATTEKGIEATPSLLESPVVHKVNDIPAKSNGQDQIEMAMAAMRAAEKVLNHRHAAMSPHANTNKKMKRMDSFSKKTDSKSTRARLPAHIAPSKNRRPHHKIANDAIEAMQRRRAIIDLAFFAAAGCPTNISIIDQINAHFQLKARHPENELPDVTFEVNGLKIRASQLPHGSIERNWIARYNASRNNHELVNRRLMSNEDHERIVTQLFPEERRVILNPQHFEIFVTGLGEEGILTKGQARTIAKLAVTVEEFDKGAHYTGPSIKNAHAHHREPSMVAMFDIPQRASQTNASFSSRPTKHHDQNELYIYLLILVEAAVYDQKFWNGYFFPNARSKLTSFYDAYKLSQEGCLLPPNLTAYKRDWTTQEVRLLQRGHLIVDLLTKYDSNEITDFGIIRAIRGTYVSLSAQPFLNLENLETFLYHRITDSGLSISKIPDILILHPENDTVVASFRLGQHVLAGLRDRASVFEKEEKTRLSEIETSYATFKQAKRKEMSPWERVKASWKKAFEKKEVLSPFDPFAPEHSGEVV